MPRSIFLILLYGLYSLSYAISAQEISSPNRSEQIWKAGVARAVITPTEDMWMAGYAARDKPAEGKLQDLWVKTLAIEDKQGQRALLITTDVIGFSRDLAQLICNRLLNTYRLDRKNIILSSSHTHSGPVMNTNLYGIYPPFDDYQKKQVEDYRHFIVEQIIVVAGRAIDNMGPVRLSKGIGIARFAVNRRESGWAGEVMYNPDVKGPSDHAVQVLKVNGEDDLPVAVVFGYSCHATSLSGNWWSGDYPGFAQIELEKTYPGIMAMFYGGFGADQNPFPRKGVLEAEQYGKELAIAVEKVMKEPDEALVASFQSIYKEIELDIAPPPGKEELDQLIENGADWEVRWAKGIKEKIASGEDMPGSYPYYPVQTWQLGDQILIVLGGEVVVDYVFRFREIFGNDLMIMGYANDVMAYIPSERILKEGGYEGKTSMWVYGHRGTWLPGIEEKIVAEVVRQVNLIKSK